VCVLYPRGAQASGAKVRAVASEVGIGGVVSSRGRRDQFIVSSGQKATAGDLCVDGRFALHRSGPGGKCAYIAFSEIRSVTGPGFAISSASRISGDVVVRDDTATVDLPDDLRAGLEIELVGVQALNVVSPGWQKRRRGRGFVLSRRE